MSAETELYSVLSGAAGVTALVGTRIYPDVVPVQKDLPAIAFMRSETEYVNTIHGTAPLAKVVTLEVGCMAAVRLDAEALADAVEAAVAVGGFIVVGRVPDLESGVDYVSTVLTVKFWE